MPLIEYDLRELLLKRGLSYTESPILNLIKQLQEDYGLTFDINKGPWIAGGAVRKLVIGEKLGDFSDIDIFFQDRDTFNSYMGKINNYSKTNKKQVGKVYSSSMAYTHHLPKLGKVQLINKQFYSSPYQLLGGFDYTIIQLVTDGITLMTGEETIEHIDAWVFDINRINKETNAVGRFFKYCILGYTPLPGVTLRMHHIVRNDMVNYTRRDGY